VKEEITLAEYRRLTSTRTARHARPDIPRAEGGERDGLTALLRRGWSVQSPDCVHYRLYQFGGADTGLCETAALACARARELEAA